MKFLKQLWENREFIAGMLLILFLALFLRQCSVTRDLKNELATTKHISEQNIAALGDKEIQLKVTKDQLAVIDTQLHKALVRVDSLKNIKSKVISIDNVSNTVTLDSNTWLVYSNVVTVSATHGSNEINITSLTGSYDEYNNGNYSNTENHLEDI